MADVLDDIKRQLAGWRGETELRVGPYSLAATLEQAADELATLRARLTEAEARTEKAENLADKYKWQVRDTCRRAEKAEARAERAEEALRPFAEVAANRAADAPQWQDSDSVDVVLHIGDLRRARAALDRKEPDK